MNFKFYCEHCGIDGLKTLLEIYKLEESISITSFFDTGFNFKVGDETNGYGYQKSFEETELSEAFNWLWCAAAYKHFSRELEYKWKECEGEEFSEELNGILYEIYMEDMPYGTAKARDGDPDEWIINELDHNYEGAVSSLKDYFESGGEWHGKKKWEF